MNTLRRAKLILLLDDDYRKICRISMYPNVMNYLEALEKDKEKILKFLRRIIRA